jgi:hypothetical protein
MEWYGAPGVTEEDERDEDGRLRGVLLRYEYPPRLVAHASSADIELVPGWTTEGQSLRGRTLRPRATWRVAVAQPASVADLLRQFASPLQDLVALGAGAPCHITDVHVFASDLVDSRTKQQQDVEVVYGSHRVGVDSDNVLLRSEMLFTANELGDRFAEAVTAWLPAWSELRSVCGLFFGPGYFGLDAFDNRVMNAVQAAEAFHRVRFDGLEVSTEEHEARLGGLLETAPEALRGWLKRKLKYSNEVDLGRRLRDLYERVKPIAEQLAPDRERFLRLLTTARNNLAHRGAFAAETDSRQLHHAVEALKYILKASLVMELGCSKDEAAALFRYCRPFENQVEFGKVFS